MTSSSRLFRPAIVAATVFMIIVSVGGASASASAHDVLVSTSPHIDQTVTDELKEVSLTFNAVPLTSIEGAIQIEVIDPTRATITTGPVTVINTTLSIPVRVQTPGVHQVLWRTVSVDGHPIAGEFTFDYEGPVPSAQTTIAPSPASTPSETPAAGPARNGPSATSNGQSVFGESALVIILGAVVLITMTTVLLAFLSRRKNTDHANDQ